MPEMRFDHIALLVNDLDESVAKWRSILEALDPAQAAEVSTARARRTASGCAGRPSSSPGAPRSSWSTLSPARAASCARSSTAEARSSTTSRSSSDVYRTVGELRERGLPILQEQQTAPDTYPWLRWNFVPNDWSGGVLVEAAQRYAVSDGRWVPVEGDPQ